MVLSQPQLGFSITSPFKAVGKGILKVVEDPRARRVGSVAAQTYAPDQYAQVQSYATQADQILHPHQQVALLPRGGMMPPGPGGYDDGGGDLPVQKSHMLGIAAIVAGGLIVFLLVRK